MGFSGPTRALELPQIERSKLSGQQKEAESECLFPKDASNLLIKVSSW